MKNDSIILYWIRKRYSASFNPYITKDITFQIFIDSKLSFFKRHRSTVPEKEGGQAPFSIVFAERSVFKKYR